MNAAIEKDSQVEIMEEKDADSRRFLKETAQNYTEAPWEVGKAGQQVIIFLLPYSIFSGMCQFNSPCNILTSFACMLQWMQQRRPFTRLCALHSLTFYIDSCSSLRSMCE